MNLSSVVPNLQTKDDRGEVLVRVENVSKRFCRSLKKSLWYGLQDIGSEIIGRKYEHELRPDEFWAVNDVSFELRRGECLGLIGRNGAGKSTLLRMLNGLIKPDRGYIEINGQVGGLIALGAGFNPILTGRENIYVNGSILGLSKKEIDAKFEEIIDFAEIGEFIDAPVQTYSSGMNVRLGFAVAAVLVKPDVLLLDEVLAVGDIGFTIKCLNQVRSIVRDSAVVFVSHSMQFVSLFCTRLILFQSGKITCDTYNLAKGIDSYLQLFPIESNLAGLGQAQINNVVVSSVQVVDNISEELELKVNQGESICLKFNVRIDPGLKAKLMLVINNQSMTPVVACPVVGDDNKEVIFYSGSYSISVEISGLSLTPGKYSFVINITDVLSNISLARLQGCAPFRVVGENVYWAPVVKTVQAICS